MSDTLIAECEDELYNFRPTNDRIPFMINWQPVTMSFPPNKSTGLWCIAGDDASVMYGTVAPIDIHGMIKDSPRFVTTVNQSMVPAKSFTHFAELPKAAAVEVKKLEIQDD